MLQVRESSVNQEVESISKEEVRAAVKRRLVRQLVQITYLFR